MQYIYGFDGSVLCELNTSNYDDVINKIYSEPNLKDNREFVILQNKNIIYYSRCPLEPFFKQKLNDSDNYSCVRTALSTNEKYILLFSIVRELIWNCTIELRNIINNINDVYKDDDEFMAIICAFACFSCLQYASFRLQNSKEFLLLICEKRNAAAWFVIRD